MTAVFAATIAVAGTLLGSALTYVFQRQTSERAAVLSFAHQLRQDRLPVYSAFAESAILFRKSEIDRWAAHDVDPGSEQYRIARAESDRLRAELRNCHLRVQLVTDDQRLHDLGTSVIETTYIIHKATSSDDCTSRASAAIDVIRQFIKYAATTIQYPQLQLRATPAITPPGSLP